MNKGWSRAARFVAAHTDEIASIPHDWAPKTERKRAELAGLALTARLGTAYWQNTANLAATQSRHPRNPLLGPQRASRIAVS